MVHILRPQATVKIAIIGGGASGVIAAISLLRRLGRRAELTLFDPAERLGAGLAYGTDHTSHLLNVPVGRMSALPDKPDDFLKWIEAHAAGVLLTKHFPFVPRALYRHYLQERLSEAEAVAGRQINWTRARATRVEPGAAGWSVAFEGGVSGPYEHCLVATGYQPQESKVDWEKIKQASEVAIAGAGLSAIDHWLHLREDGYAGVVHFFSRRGLFPIPHATVAPVVDALSPLGQTPRQLFSMMREWRARYEWSAIADWLRPNVAKIWSAWSARERRQFVSHIKPYWELIRHRVPATVFEDLRQDLASGRAKIHRGRLANGFAKFAIVLNATGAQVQTPPMIIGGPSATLHLIGPASKTLHWEITAVPEIVQQTADIAAKIQPLRLLETTTTYM